MNLITLLKTIFIVEIISVPVSSCYIAEYDVPTYKRTINLKGTAGFNTTDFIIYDYAIEPTETSFLSNNGFTNLYRLKENKISLSHIGFRDEYYNLLIENGTFKIIGDKGDLISGSYYGGGQGNENGNLASLLIMINGGSGYYSKAKGTLSADINLDQTDPSKCIMNYSGQIILPLGTQNSGI